MTFAVLRFSNFLALGFAAFLLAACSGILPGTGPNKPQIRKGDVSKEGNAFVVEVSNYVADAANYASRTGFSAEFINAAAVTTDLIRPGDVLVLTVYENVEAGILGTAGVPSNIQEIQVDSRGNIFVPYAGRITAAGRSTDSLRRILTNALAAQTPDPQVIVRRAAGDGSTVSIIGSGAQGVYPITASTTHLSQMIAQAGGVSTDPENTKVTVVRGLRRGTVFLSDLFQSSNQDIHLRPGDRIIIEEDQRRFTVLGALSGQGLATFPKPNMTALEAIAFAGGLSNSSSDPTGIFVLRDEAGSVANTVLRRNDLAGSVRVAYVINLTSVNGMFIARDFEIRDGDTLFVTEAPYSQFAKVLSALVTPISQATSLGNNL